MDILEVDFNCCVYKIDRERFDEINLKISRTKVSTNSPMDKYLFSLTLIHDPKNIN